VENLLNGVLFFNPMCSDGKSTIVSIENQQHDLPQLISIPNGVVASWKFLFQIE
jgi:hypothetical protein